MFGMTTTALRVCENLKIPSWVPWRWHHIAFDLNFYDAIEVALAEWFHVYRIDKPMPEASIIVVPPGITQDGDFEVYDVRDYLEDSFRDIEVLTVPGCGSSRVGTIALARTVANALNKPVASLISSYGTRDLMGEAMSGATIFFPMNWFLQATDDALPPYLGLDVYDFTYAVPEAAALHSLLLHRPGRFKTIVGHSKGNFAIAAALHALKVSLASVDDTKTLEGTFGLSRSGDLQALKGEKPVTAAQDKTDIFTFGCVVSLPHKYGYHGRHMYPSHQYVGNGDIVLGFFGSGPLKIMSMYLKGEITSTAKIADKMIVAGTPLFGGNAFSPITGHNLVESNPMIPGYYCHMPISDILRTYAQEKWSEKGDKAPALAALPQQKRVAYTVEANALAI
jgi:hypothetical protein